MIISFVRESEERNNEKKVAGKKSCFDIRFYIVKMWNYCASEILYFIPFQWCEKNRIW